MAKIISKIRNLMKNSKYSFVLFFFANWNQFIWLPESYEAVRLKLNPIKNVFVVIFFYIEMFSEVRQLCLKYTQHKYLVDWTIRKKDTLF